MVHGDYLSYRIDWQNKTMQLVEIGPVLEKHCPQTLDTPYAIPPLVHAMECFSRMSPPGELPYRFLVDMRYDRESLLIKVHSSEDYTSVVDVPCERLEALLGPLLTPRETQIAALLFEGCTIRYIACMLHIAEGTVKRIIHNIYQKMSVGSQVELVREIYARLAQCYSTNA